MMVVRLLILIVLTCSFSNIKIWASEQPIEQTTKKRKAEIWDLLPEAKRRKVEESTTTPNLSTAFEPFRHLSGEEDKETQAKILDYFKEKEGIMLSSSEMRVLNSLPLETWTHYLSVYEPTFSKLCLLKASPKQNWSLPEQVKDHIFSQAHQGVASALFLQGKMYSFGVSVEQDFQKAFNLFHLAAEKEYTPALFEIALMYELGLGTDKNNEKAFNYLLTAANKDYTPAQWKVGVYYFMGHGIKKDLEKAFYYSFQAAQKNHPHAQYDVGIMYCEGHGIPKDDKKAFDYFLCAAEQEHVKAQYKVGLMYREGHGTPKDDKKAFDFLLCAAQQNHVKAQYEVGIMYAYGRGVATDIDQTLKWHLAVNRNKNLPFERPFSPFIKTTFSSSVPRADYFSFLQKCQHKTREFYGTHMLEENINNLNQTTIEKMRENRFAIPTLYPHYKMIVAYEKRALEILSAFTLPGFMINSWQVNSLLLPNNIPLESLKYYRRYKHGPYGDYFSFGETAVKKMNELIELISDVSSFKASFIKSAQSLKAIYEKLCIDTSAEVIQRQTELRLGNDIPDKQDLQEEFSELNVRLEHYQKHLEGLEYVELLPNYLHLLISKGVSNRNKIFEVNHPSIFEE